MNLTRGFSLVEVMVATTLGALISAGAITAVAHSRASWAAAEQENRLHERAQYVFATLEPDLQMAGYFSGPAPLPLPLSSIPANAAACGAAVVARVDRAVESSDARYPYGCAAQGRGYLPGTDVLIIRRLSARVPALGDGRLAWLTCLVPDCTPRLLTGVLPAVPPTHGAARDLLVRLFYVSRGADGDPETPSLRVKSLSAVAGTPAFIDTEVMPGVNDLQVEFQPDAGQPRTVRVTIGVQPDAADRRAGTPLRRVSLTRQFALRNAQVR